MYILLSGKAFAGQVYCVVGIHPDNVDKTNSKKFESMNDHIEELGRRPESVGVLTGLNMSREVRTHFAQGSFCVSS